VVVLGVVLDLFGSPFGHGGQLPPPQNRHVRSPHAEHPNPPYLSLPGSLQAGSNAAPLHPLQPFGGGVGPRDVVVDFVVEL